MDYPSSYSDYKERISGMIALTELNYMETKDNKNLQSIAEGICFIYFFVKHI